MSGLRNNLVLVVVFLLLLGLSAWMQFGLLEPPVDEMSEEDKNAPDYYIENFVSTGMDKHGKVYELRGRPDGALSLRRSRASR